MACFGGSREGSEVFRSLYQIGTKFARPLASLPAHERSAATALKTVYALLLGSPGGQRPRRAHSLLT